MEYRTKKQLKNIRIILAGIIVFSIVEACSSHRKPTLFLIGDSTMANKEKLYLPERGWGQVLPIFFTDEIHIENHAKNGRSTRSFIYEGRWDSVMDKIIPGDFVLIQFGHNDESFQKTERYATPREYSYNLVKFVNETRDRGATPILCTPIVRRRFDDQHLFYDTHGEYPDTVRAIARRLQVPLFEMHAKSGSMIESLGEDSSKVIYLFVDPGINDSLPEGLIDNTHFSEYGALKMAEISVDEIRAQLPELEKYLKK